MIGSTPSLCVGRRTNALMALVLALFTSVPAFAQFYAKVDFQKAASDSLYVAFSGIDRATGSNVAGLVGTEDPLTEELFRAMARSAIPGPRVYGILGAALLTKKGIDADLMANLKNADERAAVIREANITGILRTSPVAQILAQGNFTDGATLSLVGELDRRGESWSPALIEPLVNSPDAVAAGVAALLLRDGNGKDATNAAPWNEFKVRLLALTPLQRNSTLRALVEAAIMFEIRSAAAPLLELSQLPEFNLDTRIGAIGMALRLDPALGLTAWQNHVAANRTQVSLVRAGMQLLASADKNIPPTAFDAIRNGNGVLDAIADTGNALASDKDPAAALIALLDANHPLSAEWALVRASELPPEKSAAIWKHLLARMNDPDPTNRPTAVLVSGLARELMDSDPEVVKALVEQVKGDPELIIAAMTGVNDSRRPAGAEIARARRGTMPRAAEGLAVLILARANAPLTDADIDVLGRAAAGGGDLDEQRALQAAWFYTRSRKNTQEVIARISSSAPVLETQPVAPTSPASTPSPAAPK